jgi:hypothetical protein
VLRAPRQPLRSDSPRPSCYVRDTGNRAASQRLGRAMRPGESSHLHGSLQRDLHRVRLHRVGVAEFRARANQSSKFCPQRGKRSRGAGVWSVVAQVRGRPIVVACKGLSTRARTSGPPTAAHEEHGEQKCERARWMPAPLQAPGRRRQWNRFL